MVDGLAYVRRNRLVLGAITLDLFAVLLGGATAMLPLYARDILQVGADGLGPLRAAPAAGATLTAIFFSVRPLKTDVGVKMLAAVVVFGAATAVFGISRSYFLSLAMLALLGAADMFSVYIRQSLIQLHTPDEMRGRVAAASTLAISASNELGETAAGFTAALLGPVAATVAGGIAAIGVTLLWALLFPELRRARTLRAGRRAAARRCRHRRRRLTLATALRPPDVAATREGDPCMKAANILETIGNTPHIRINRLFGDAEVWIKSERSNPGGSIKDRIALSMVEDAERSGKLQAGRRDRRADLRQYRHRPRHGRGGQGLQADPGHARQHERSSGGG